MRVCRHLATACGSDRPREFRQRGLFQVFHRITKEVLLTPTAEEGSGQCLGSELVCGAHEAHLATACGEFAHLFQPYGTCRACSKRTAAPLSAPSDARICSPERVRAVPMPSPATASWMLRCDLSEPMESVFFGGASFFRPSDQIPSLARYVSGSRVLSLCAPCPLATPNIPAKRISKSGTLLAHQINLSVSYSFVTY